MLLLLLVVVVSLYSLENCIAQCQNSISCHFKRLLSQLSIKLTIKLPQQSDIRRYSDRWMQADTFAYGSTLNLPLAEALIMTFLLVPFSPRLRLSASRKCILITGCKTPLLIHDNYELALLSRQAGRTWLAMYNAYVQFLIVL